MRHSSRIGALAPCLLWTWLLCSSVGVATAHAEGSAVALLDAEPNAGAWAEALRVELAASQVQVVIGAPPSGATTLLRSADAQRVAREANAVYAVWVEHTDSGDFVRAVGAESEDVRDAPLPAAAGGVAPRTFAAVAASLLDELVAPPTPAVRVTVRVETPTGVVDLDAVSNPEGAGGLRAPRVVVRNPVPTASVTPALVAVGAPATPDAADAADATPSDGPLMPREGFVLSPGIYTAGIALGGELGLGYYVSDDMRLSAFGMLGLELMNGSQTGLVGLDVTHVGEGRDARFDYGAFGSLLMVAGQNARCVDPGCTSTSTTSLGVVVGAHLGWMWELSSSFALGFRVSGGGAFVEPSFDITPYGLVTLVSEIGL